MDGSGDHNVDTNRAASISLGLPARETWRFGGSSTGMSDDQKNLDYRPGDYSSWTDWTGGLCGNDASFSGTNNWNGYMYSSTEYKTLKASDYCPKP